MSILLPKHLARWIPITWMLLQPRQPKMPQESSSFSFSSMVSACPGDGALGCALAPDKQRGEHRRQGQQCRGEEVTVPSSRDAAPAPQGSMGSALPPAMPWGEWNGTGGTAGCDPKPCSDLCSPVRGCVVSQPSLCLPPNPLGNDPDSYPDPKYRGFVLSRPCRAAQPQLHGVFHAWEGSSGLQGLLLQLFPTKGVFPH